MKNLIQKMWCTEKIICISNNILQKIWSQKSFLWESEMTTKRTTILESFVIVGSFDCDHAQTNFWTIMGENPLRCTTQDEKT
jgi:hypothetical protein